MNDREKWRERVRDIHATSTTWWWWWWGMRMRSPRFDQWTKTEDVHLLNNERVDLNLYRFFILANARWIVEQACYFSGLQCQYNTLLFFYHFRLTNVSKIKLVEENKVGNIFAYMLLAIAIIIEFEHVQVVQLVFFSLLNSKLIISKIQNILFYCWTFSLSSSYRAASTDIPDPLSPRLPIIHRLRQVFRVTSRIIT